MSESKKQCPKIAEKKEVERIKEKTKRENRLKTGRNTIGERRTNQGWKVKTREKKSLEEAVRIREEVGGKLRRVNNELLCDSEILENGGELNVKTAWGDL